MTEPLDFTEYQSHTNETNMMQGDLGYLLMGLTEEVGEVCGVIKKARRAGLSWEEVQGDPTVVDKVLHESGDVMWYLSEILNHLGIDMECVAANNLHKLAQRKAAGTITARSRNDE